MPKVTLLYLVGCLILCLRCAEPGAQAGTRTGTAEPAREGGLQGPQDASAERAVPPAAPPDSRRATAGNPFADSALSSGQRFGFSAVVQQRVRAGGYLYLRVRDDGGRTHWVATLGALAPERDDVSVWVMGRSERFVSKRLGREFSPLLFATVR